MSDECLSTLISEDALQARVTELAAQIRADFGADTTITCIGVLKGSFLFMADLIRKMGGDIRCEFLGVSSYHGGTRSTGVVQITQDLRSPIEGLHCLIIEDIIDTGLTLDYLQRMLSVRGPKSLKMVTLLDKPSRREVDIVPHYAGFSIPALPQPPLHRGLHPMKIIQTDAAPAAIGPYSQATVHNGLVYTSGQVALRPGVSGLIGSTAAEQAVVALENLSAVLEASGSSLGQALKVTVFLADMNDFPSVNAVYAEAFGDHRPARSTVEVARLPVDARVELDCIAVVG